MIRSISFFLIPFFFVTFFSCDNATDVTDPGPCEIISPVGNQTYSPYNPILLIVKYDRMKFTAPWWQYSLDRGKNWIDMNVDTNTVKNNYGDDVIYEFDVRQWTPFDGNGIVDTVLWIKASAYAGSVYVTEENIKIRP